MALDFFCLHATKRLPEFPKALRWDELTLQACLNEPAVTHAAIAIAAINRAQVSPIGCNLLAGSTSTTMDVSQYHFALAQYSKAMGHLHSYTDALSNQLTDSSVDVVLLLTLLFFCFNVPQQDDAGAVSHVAMGLKILRAKSKVQHRDIRGDDPGEQVIVVRARPKTRFEILAHVFVRLDSDACLATSGDEYLRPICYDPMPRSFMTLDEAMIHLDVLAGELTSIANHIMSLAKSAIEGQRHQPPDNSTLRCATFMQSRTVECPSPLLRRLHCLMEDLRAWMSAHALIRWSPQEELAHITINIQFFIIWILAKNLRCERETNFDTSIQQFAHIVSLAERFVLLDRASPASSRPAATTGTFIPACLYEIVQRCRDSKIRRRAISVIRCLNLQGVFDGFFVFSWLSCIVQLEESRAREIDPTLLPVKDLRCKDIPEAARILESTHVENWDAVTNLHNFYKMDHGRALVASYADTTALTGIAVQEMMSGVDRSTTGLAEGAPTLLGLPPKYLSN